MLIGEYRSKISEKGRVSIPSKYYKTTGDFIVVARWYESCLVIVGTKDWLGLLERITKKDELLVSPVRMVDRFILSSAYEAELDSQRRFVVPVKLRQYAGLKDKVVFIGLGDRIELWDEEVWRKEELRVKSQADKMLEQMAEIGKGNDGKDK